MNRLLQKKQKKAVRYVADAKYNAYFDPLLENIFEPMLTNRVLNLKVPLPKHKVFETFPRVGFCKVNNSVLLKVIKKILNHIS